MEKPCISPYVEATFEKDNRISVYNKKSGKTYVIGEDENKILSYLDGNNSIEEISKKTGKYTVEQISFLIDQFSKIGFIKGKETKNKLNIFKIKLPLINGNKLIKQDNLFWKLLNFAILYMSIPVFLIGLAYVLKNYDFRKLLSDIQLFNINNLVMVPVILLILTFHEFAHAVVARSLGLNVPEIGLMVYMFMPCAYTNLSGLTFEKSKFKRIITLFAGVLFNLLLSGILFLSTSVANQKYQMFLLAVGFLSMSMFIVNMLFFIKMDGYYILEELLDIHKLRETSFTHLKTIFAQFIFNIRYKNKLMKKYDSFSLNSESSISINNIIFTVFGILSSLYAIIITCSFMWMIYSNLVR